MQPSDKEYLKILARNILESLDAVDFKPPFVVANPSEIRNLKSGGWGIKLGIFRGYQCVVEIWFDKFTSHEERKLYYCVYSNHPDGIKKLVALSKPYLGNHVSIYSSDWSEDKKIIRLQKPLLKREFGTPVFERYSKYKEYLYGVYVFEKLGLKKNETRRLTERVVEFIATINDAISKDKLKQDAEAYAGVENRKAVKKHIQRERSSHLATLRKQRDDFVCQVCGFDYARTYGALGEDFAEAHHKVPLSKNNEQRITKVKDLITVCANCHRMLHKMSGTAGDITKLKRIVRKKSA